MGLTISKLDDTGPTVTVERKLWLDADGGLVEDGDPRAAVLYCVPGDEIPRAEAERLGLLKSRRPTRNKARKPREEK
jgi:hypothetical protein